MGNENGNDNDKGGHNYTSDVSKINYARNGAGTGFNKAIYLQEVSIQNIMKVDGKEEAEQKLTHIIQ